MDWKHQLHAGTWQTLSFSQTESWTAVLKCSKKVTDQFWALLSCQNYTVLFEERFVLITNWHVQAGVWQAASLNKRTGKAKRHTKVMWIFVKMVIASYVINHVSSFSFANLSHCVTWLHFFYFCMLFFNCKYLSLSEFVLLWLFMYVL